MLLQDSDDSAKPAIKPKNSWQLDDFAEFNDIKDPRAEYEIPKSIPIEIGKVNQSENRYIEICNGEQEVEEQKDKDTLSCGGSTSTLAQGDNPEDSGWNRTSVASLNWFDKKIDKLNIPDKRCSTASLGEKLKPTDSMRQSGSYAKLLGNGESVNSLSDYRRIKKIANEERERMNTEKCNLEETRSNGSSGTTPLITYSSVTFPQSNLKAENSDTVKSLTKLQRTKSHLQTSKANIPLVLNSGLLNVLKQAPEVEDESDENYVNSDKVTDL